MYQLYALQNIRYIIKCVVRTISGKSANKQREIHYDEHNISIIVIHEYIILFCAMYDGDGKQMRFTIWTTMRSPGLADIQL